MSISFKKVIAGIRNEGEMEPAYLIWLQTQLYVSESGTDDNNNTSDLIGLCGR
jgi:hypothetical protein